MNNHFLLMFEDMKRNRYQSYLHYLDEADMAKVHHWFWGFSSDESVSEEDIIHFMYDLYISEDIDYRVCDEYYDIASFYSEHYKFDPYDFLDMYVQFRKIIFDTSI